MHNTDLAAEQDGSALILFWKILFFTNNLECKSCLLVLRHCVEQQPDEEKKYKSV